MKPQRILFVCTGNLCRSPMAEGICRKMLDEAGLDDIVSVASAGTHARDGAPPAKLAIETAARRGVDISSLRARRLQANDFNRHDLILAMDYDNLSHLRFFCPQAEASKLKMLTGYARRNDTVEVPDPYGGEPRDFEIAADLIEAACAGLVREMLFASAGT